MEITQSSQRNIIADSVILYLGIFANLGVLVHLHKTWIKRNRVQFYVFSLCLADCLGLILRQCVEIGLHTTDTWNTGSIGCKIIMSLSLAGTILAHLILVNFNIDNVLTVLYKRSPVPVRGTLLAGAFLLTCVCIGTQAYLYNIEIHPIYTALRQCTPFGQLTSQEVTVYRIIISIALFWFPATCVVVCAVSLIALVHKGFTVKEEEDHPKRDFGDLKSDTIYVLVLDACLFICWTPYSTQQLFLATERYVLLVSCVTPGSFDPDTWCAEATHINVKIKLHVSFCILDVADIIALCVGCSFGIGIAVTIYWRGGDYGCRIINALYTLDNFLAHLILAGFNVDNAITIIINRSVKAIRITILLIAIMLAVLFSAPQVFMSKYNADPFACVAFDSTMTIVIFHVGVFWIPLLFILFCGGPALCVWCGKKGSIAYQKTNQEDSSNTDMKHIGRDIGMAAAYNTVFILCWMPTGISYILESTNGYLPEMFYKVSYYITIANSVLNPLIYAIFQCINKRRGNVSSGL